MKTEVHPVYWNNRRVDMVWGYNLSRGVLVPSLSCQSNSEWKAQKIVIAIGNNWTLHEKLLTMYMNKWNNNVFRILLSAMF